MTANGISLAAVVPNYNHGHYLQSAVDALENQELPFDEILISDDASTDGSWELVQTLAGRYENIRVRRNSRNIGVVANLNQGLSETRCDYVCFPAADDRVFPGFVKSSLSLLKGYPNAALSSGLSTVIDENGADKGIFPSPMALSRSGYISAEDALKLLLKDDSWIMGNTTVYRRDALEEIGGFPTELGSFTDSFVARVLTLRHGACFVPQPLAAWRRSEEGFAGATARDPRRTLEIFSAARALMTGKYAGLFPAEYLARWEKRWRFGALTTLLAHDEGASYDGVSPHWPGLSRSEWLILRACSSIGAPTHALAVLYLFLRLRSKDLFPLMLRRADWWLTELKRSKVPV